MPNKVLTKDFVLLHFSKMSTKILPTGYTPTFFLFTWFCLTYLFTCLFVSVSTPLCPRCPTSLQWSTLTWTQRQSLIWPHATATVWTARTWTVKETSSHTPSAKSNRPTCSLSCRRKSHTATTKTTTKRRRKSRCFDLFKGKDL